MQFDLAGTFVLETLVETVDITLQAAMADEETGALGLPTGSLRAEQVVAHLKSVQRAIEPWRDSAGPGLLDVFPIDPAPACAKRAGFFQQALITLSIMEGAECRQGQLRGRRRQH